MKRSIVFFALAAAAIVSLLGCDLAGILGGVTGGGAAVGKVVRGSGEAGESTFTVSDFDKLVMTGTGEVSIDIGSETALRVEAEDNIIPHLTATVDSGALTIGHAPGIILQPTLPIRYYLTVPALSSINVSGEGIVRGPGFETESFTIDISGSGSVDTDDINAAMLNVAISGDGAAELGGVYAGTLDIDVSGAGRLEIENGEVTTQHVKITGDGSCYAKGLSSQQADVDISGDGSASIAVSDSLQATISGSGALEYVGNPTVDQSISGDGRLNHTGD
jgi:hypothetical protein